MKTTAWLLFSLTLLLLTSCVSPYYVWTSETIMMRYREDAITAINTPDVWAQFPDVQHAASYKVDAAGIEYLFNYYRRGTVAVRVPVKTTEDTHGDYVDVVFESGQDKYVGFQIVDMRVGRH